MKCLSYIQDARCLKVKSIPKTKAEYKEYISVLDGNIGSWHQKYFHSCVERQAGCHVGCEITDLAVCAVVARLCVKCYN